MREIKFRAWDEKRKTMLLWGAIDAIYQRLSSESPIGLRVGELHIIDFELMQFTGLHDKNGKEIFESDLLTNGHRRIGIVEWSDACWGVDWQDGTKAYLASVCEFNRIIGNIYQNPELLETKSP